MAQPTPEQVVRQVNTLCKDQVEKLYAQIEALGGVDLVRDEHGRKIPQPQTERERIMFAAGQISLALFIQGATT